MHEQFVYIIDCYFQFGFFLLKDGSDDIVKVVF